MSVNIVGFSNFKCFKGDRSDVGLPRGINVVIGRNNAGKSFLIDLVQLLCKQGTQPTAVVPANLHCVGSLSEQILRHAFPESDSEGYLVGNHWRDHGIHLCNKYISYTTHPDSTASVDTIGDNDVDATRRLYIERHTRGEGAGKKSKLSALLFPLPTFYKGKCFRRISAERNISIDKKNDDVSHGELGRSEYHLGFDGKNAINLIRKFLHTSSDDFDKSVITVKLLDSLNQIFGPDGTFNHFEILEQDHTTGLPTYGHYELYLHENNKSRVPLSSSGSGLKTVLLVLLNTIVIPSLENQDPSKYLFAFEELENNLHPSLLRRLFRYLEDFVEKTKATLYLTTHSSIAIDFFSASEKHTIIHVTQTDGASVAKRVNAHFDKLSIVSDLGAKPSDLLQSNGIIWVEGPSDRVYLNKWIDLVSAGKWREGRDYQCAFYGGANLANVQSTAQETEDKELVNLMRINPNHSIICDSDRIGDGDDQPLKKRVQRIVEEFKDKLNPLWVTKAKEVENYIPGEVWSKVFDKSDIPDPQLNERFFPAKSGGTSYVENHMKSFGSKVDRARQAVEHMTLENMSSRGDLKESIERIISAIEKWNS